ADDALLVSEDGSYLECTTANVFFVLGSRLLTPAASAPILPGIARARVLGVARALGYEPEEGRVGDDEARRAEECFVTNAVLLAHAVAAVEGVAVYSRGDAAARFAQALPAQRLGNRIIPG
ncbi:MAG: aminotransferase class IV, partial [Planctomycetota bacterium]